ncbi:unnamed protein product [Owenia fusiformis]|uniref:Uncharacterized protein n=1 Tax=Owenia fusiformis TaxID=6347 RepID=A0A8S4N381_OWEFU|nr:unnamed protein product [Owenia fusiformis]
MKVDLQVLAASSIKRKKPWPRFAWLGQSTESLFMVDTHRLSVLYLPSGKTKRTIPKVSPLLKTAATLSTSNNGAYVCGLLQSGDLFLWHKDTDHLKSITGTPALCKDIAGGAKPGLWVSDDADRVLVMNPLREIFMWESRIKSATGTWTKVEVAHGHSIPASECKETAVSVVFYNNQALGKCCECSMVFYRDGQLHITTVLLQWYLEGPIHSDRAPGYNAEWSEMCVNLARYRCIPVRSRGALLAKYTHSGGSLGVIVNQRNPLHTISLTVSPLTHSVLVNSMKGCGTRADNQQQGRKFWITDIAWTHNDTFLVCITKHGFVCTACRGGEPVSIQSQGCSVEMGPALYLPLHPLITVQTKKTTSVPQAEVDQSITSTQSDADQMRQRFSISTHPRLPIILCSDGYLVTVLQIDANTSCAMVVKGFIFEANLHIKTIKDTLGLNTTLADSMHTRDASFLNMSIGSQIRQKQKNKLSSGMNLAQQKGKTKSNFEFEKLSDTLDNTGTSDLSGTYYGDRTTPGLFFGASQAESGRIDFGDIEAISVDSSIEDYANLGQMSVHISKARDLLKTAWNLVVTNTEPWGPELELHTKHIKSGLSEVIRFMLNVNDGASDNEEPIKIKITKVLSFVCDLLQMLHFDTIRQGMMTHGLTLILRSMHTILSYQETSVNFTRVALLHSTWQFMQWVSKKMNQIYAWLPKPIQMNAIPRHVQLGYTDWREPAILLALANTSGALSKQIPTAGTSQESTLSVSMQQNESMAVASLIERRLSIAWKLLYIESTEHWCNITRSRSNKQEVAKMSALTLALQHKIQALGCQVPFKSSTQINKGCQLYLDGMYDAAVDEWMLQLSQLTDDESTSVLPARLLLAIAYTHLHQHCLYAVLDLLLSAMSQHDPRNIPAQLENQHLTTINVQVWKIGDPLPPVVTCPNSRILIQNVGRFMASYFTSSTLYVYPAHQPRVLSPLMSTSHEGRLLLVDRASITQAISEEGVSALWTVDGCLHYLLLGGLVSEAVWFAHSIGDWKSALILSVMCKKVSAIRNWTECVPLPQELQAEELMKSKLLSLVQSCTQINRQSNSSPPSIPTPEGKLQRSQSLSTIQSSTASPRYNADSTLEQISRTLGDTLQCGVICGVSLTPWLLGKLIDKLKAVVSNMSTLVPEGFYLPAPPLYCPQPTVTELGVPCIGVEDEQRYREEISSIVQLILMVLQVSNLDLPTARCYTHKLNILRKMMGNPTKEEARSLRNLQENFLQPQDILTPHEDQTDICESLHAFRELCCNLWHLKVRDSLTQHLRIKKRMAENAGYPAQVSRMSSTAWLEHAHRSLNWATAMLPFTRFMSNENEAYDIVLSLLEELPANQDTANLLAEHFYDIDSLDPIIQDKVNRLLKEWRRVKIQKVSGKGKSKSKNTKNLILSVYFHHQTKRMVKEKEDRIALLGEYEEFIYTGEPSVHPPCIGSRSYEADFEFWKFLDTFLDIALARSIQNEADPDHKQSQPYLKPFFKGITNSQLESVAKKTSIKMHLKNKLGSTMEYLQDELKFTSSSPGEKSPKESAMKPPSSPQKFLPKSTNHKPRGLFRSKSLSELQPIRRGDHRVAKVTPILRHRSSSQSNLKSSPLRNKPLRKADQGGSSSDLRKFVTFNQTKLQKLASASMKSLGSTSSQTIKSWAEATKKSKPAILEPLQKPMDLVKVDNIEKKFEKLGKFLNWLVHWSGKHHVFQLGPDTNENEHKHTKKSSIRVNVTTSLLLHSVWIVNQITTLSDNEKVQNLASEPAMETLNDSVRLPPEVDNSVEANESSKDVTNKSENEPQTYKPATPLHQKILKRMRQKSTKTKPKEKENMNNRDTKPKQKKVKGKQIDHKDLNSFKADKSRTPDENIGTPASAKPLTESVKIPNQQIKEVQNVSFNVSDSSNSTLGVSSIELSTGSLRSFLHKLSKPGLRQAGQEPLDSTALPDFEPTDAGHPKSGSGIVEDTMAHSPLLLPTADKPSQSLEAVNTNDSGSNMGEQTGDFGVHSDNFEVQSGNLGVQPSNLGVQPGDLGVQLQNIVRGEMRKIMELQHQGLLAMIGAMDGAPLQQPTSDTQIPQASKVSKVSNNQQPNISKKNSSHKHQRSKPRKKKVEPSVEESTVEATGTYSDTSIDISSKTLDLDDLRAPTLKSKVSTLRDTDTPFNKDKPKYSSVVSALRELDNLKDINSRPHSTPKKSSIDPIDKENIQAYPIMGQPEPGSQNQQGFMKFSAQNPPKLLKMPTQKNTDSQVMLKLPKLPTRAELLGLTDENKQKEATHMPLLQIDNAYPQIPEAPKHYNLGSFHIPTSKANHARTYEGGITDRPDIFMFHPKSSGQGPNSGSRQQIPKYRPPSTYEPSQYGPRQPDPKYGHNQPTKPFPLLRLPKAIDFLTQGNAGAPSMIHPHSDISHEQQEKPTDRYPSGDTTITNEMVTKEEPEDLPSKESESMPDLNATRNSRKRKERRDRLGESQSEPNLASKRDTPDKLKMESRGTTTFLESNKPTFQDSTQQTDPKVIIEDDPNMAHLEVDDVKTSDGYAITPGTFDEYFEHQDELGEVYDNNAKIQLAAATGIRPKTRKTVSFAVGVQTSEPPTDQEYKFSTKATPIEECVNDYMKARAAQGNLLAPNIFFGLRFGDHDNAPQSDVIPGTNGKSEGRSYISVVDIDSTAVDDLVSSIPPSKSEPNGTGLPHRTVSPNQLQQPIRQQSRLPPKPEGLEEGQDGNPQKEPEKKRGSDPLTVNLFTDNQAGEDQFVLPSVETYGQSRRQRSKAAMQAQLEQMGDQLQAIDQMSHTMEGELQNSRALLHTIEAGATIEAQEPDIYKDMGNLRPSQVKQYNTGTRKHDQEREDYEIPNLEDNLAPKERVQQIKDKLNPRPTKVDFNQDYNNRDESEIEESESYEKGESPERLSTDSKPQVGSPEEGSPERSVTQFELTGLSGISDIIGEVLADEDIKPGDVGLTEKEMLHLKSKAGPDKGELTTRELQAIFGDPKHKGPISPQRTEAQRKRLHAWMAERKQQQDTAYRQQLDERRGLERNPYVPNDDIFNKSASTMKEIQELENSRLNEKTERESEFDRKRRKQAERLMGEILSDTLELPDDNPARLMPDASRKIKISQKKKALTRGRTPDDFHRYETPMDKYTESPDEYRDSRLSHYIQDDYAKYPLPDQHFGQTRTIQHLAQTKSQPRASTSNQQQQGQRREGIRDRKGPESTQGRDERNQRRYLEPLDEENEDSSRPVPSPRRSIQQKKDDERMKSTYKAAPFTSKVRLQRPEVTRKHREQHRESEPYVDRLAKLTATEGNFDVSTPITPRTRTGLRPRVPATQEAQNPIRRGMRTSPQKRRPLTYTERLKQLQPPKSKSTRIMNVLSPRKTQMRTQPGPTHKPKTYTQQLQEINAAAPRASFRRAYSPAPLTSRARSRARPYASPYAENIDSDQDTELSPWSVDNDVRRILYRDDSYTGIVSHAQSQLTDPDEMSYLQGDYNHGDYNIQGDYTASVDIADLVQVDELSMSNGSIMSYIDWDAVDDLIADVK